MTTELLFLVVIVLTFFAGMGAGYALATKHVKDMVLEAEDSSTPFWDEVGTPSIGNLPSEAYWARDLYEDEMEREEMERRFLDEDWELDDEDV